jgi:hypothetical protein
LKHFDLSPAQFIVTGMFGQFSGNANRNSLLRRVDGTDGVQKFQIELVL